MRKLLSCVVVCALWTACAWAQEVKPAPSKAEVLAAAEKELLAAEKAFCDDWHARGAEAWAYWFAPNGVEDTGETPAVGPEAVRKSIQETYGVPGASLTWAADEARAMENGRMGFTRGHFVAKFIANGKPLEIRGQYITIWRKQKDGNWRIVWDGGEALKD